MSAHVVDPAEPGPFDRCRNCRQPVNDYGDGRGLVTMVTGEAECHVKERS